ncbi:MAG: hypothetical protein KC425_01610, partial [Anaerolineales bacterium]|nr:hypothetical protein [Anaerolineales bacterium]
ATPTPAAPGGPTTVSFVPLPTAATTPTPPPRGQPVAFTVHVYFDANDNGVKDADEGIAGLPVYVYTGLLPMPVRAVTTAGGAVYVETETAVGSVQLRVPYLNISQDVAATAVQDVRLRVAAP